MVKKCYLWSTSIVHVIIVSHGAKLVGRELRLVRQLSLCRAITKVWQQTGAPDMSHSVNSLQTDVSSNNPSILVPASMFHQDTIMLLFSILNVNRCSSLEALGQIAHENTF